MPGVSEFSPSTSIRRLHLPRVDPMSFREHKLHVELPLPNHPSCRLVDVVKFKLREVSGQCERLIFFKPFFLCEHMKKKPSKNLSQL